MPDSMKELVRICYMVEQAREPYHYNQKPELKEFQQEVLQLLEDVCTLMNDTKENLSIDSSGEKYQQFHQQITEASHNVADLQLRMGIIAPMKAGKSTIINAIIGQEILPSCAAAMTTIPTEIVFNQAITEPLLTLSQDTLAIFRDVYQGIQNQIQQLGIELSQQKIARYPHLMELLSEIHQTNYFPFAQQITGREAINQALTSLNHLIRLCSILEPLREPLAQLRDIPYIQTPCLSLVKQEPGKSFGNLVIIDTPGPNEAGEHLKLTAVVEEQLRRSSIVLIVLDFTQLNNEAAEAIKKQVKPVIELIGQDNLYVLVNKIDQRRQGDLTPEQVKKFVLADLELTQLEENNRVFEVAAIRAFTATKFLLELQQNPESKPEEMATAEALAQEVFGIDWEEELETTNVDVLAKKAGTLWKKSGFAPFLDQAIQALMITAAPRCLNSALNLSRHRLLELKDDLNIRSKAISQDAAKLQSEIKALEQDLNHLESCRTRLTQIDRVKIGLQENLETILTQLKDEAVVKIEDYFVETDYDRGDLFKKADIKTRELLLTNIGSFELFPKWVSENLKSNLEYKTARIAAFRTEVEAEQFAQKAISWAKQRLDSLLLKVRENTENKIELSRQEIFNFLAKETQPIIERAKVRLQENFEINLVLPTPGIYSETEINIGQRLVKTKTRLVEQGLEERIIKARAWYYWFGLVPFYRQETYQKPYKKENYYTVSLHELVEQINELIEKYLDNTKQKIIIYLENELQQQVDLFFTNLDKYLGSYLDNLKQSQSDRKLSLEQREKLVKNLGDLVPQANNYINQSDSYLLVTEQFLVKNNN